MSAPLVNRVAKSGIVTINLEQFFPSKEIVVFDLKHYLHMELILKEKEFRTQLKELDWSTFQDTIVLIDCSSDAIIPVWAYMLVATYLEPFASDIYTGTKEAYLTHFYQSAIGEMDISTYQDKRIVIKGCSEKPVPKGAYQELTKRLKPIALSIMYGEPCSTVPIYKKPKEV